MALPVILVPIATSFLAWIGAFLAKVFTVETLRFLAWRAFILFIVFVCLPVVLYNVGVDLIFALIAQAMDYTGTLGFSELTIQLTGIAGYIANEINLPQCFSIYMTAIATRFAMGFIPFLR